MYCAQSFKYSGKGLGVKGFVCQLAQVASVQRIGIISPKCGYVHFPGARSNFFIRRKGYFNEAVFQFRVVVEVLHHCHNHGYTRFVVRTQQGAAGSGNNIVPACAGKLGGIGWINN